MDFIGNIAQNLNQHQPLPIINIMITFLLLVLVFPFLLVSLFSRLHRKLPYPPGPRGLPFIGNMLLMDQLTHRGLFKLAKKYGGLFHMKMGNLHMVAVSSPDVARQVLQAQDNIFSNRPATIAITYLTYDRADMAFAHYGPFWRQMRKLCVVRLFSRKRAESWTSVRDNVDRMMRTVASDTGSPVNLRELVFVLTRDIVYQAAFGTSSDAGRDEFIGILQEFSKLFGAFNIADFVPSLTWVDPHRLNDRLAKARASLDKFIDRIIDDHMVRRKQKTTHDDESDPDMVDDLLAFYDVDTKDDLQNSIRLTRENIKAIIMDVMFGGTETVASAIEWTLSELMKSPDDLKKVQQELAHVVGLDRRVVESDMEKLTFFKCVIKETLRLHPPIPLLLHETAVETEVSGYRIPAKCRVMINAYAIGRDPKSWSDPDSFRPSRFLEVNVPDFKGNHFEFIPFGSGRRSCPGMQLGIYALEMAVANLLHGFSWELPDGMKPSELDMSDMFGLTAPRATRLIAVPSPRLMCPIY